MKEYIINKTNENQRFDKYLKRIMPSASNSFIYKMLRKKNIELNSKRAKGDEILKSGDSVKIFFSDETYEKFSKGEAADVTKYLKAYEKYGKLEVIFSDENIIVFNKPSGMLSQSDESGALSVNDYLIGYLLDDGTVTADSLSSFRPSICNRLDRNTSGLILCSKSLRGARFLNRIISEHNTEKYYLALAKGRFDKEGVHTSYVKKDEKNNKLLFTEESAAGAVQIKTGFEVIRAEDEATLLKVRLYTGKSHQIRAHLSQLGHPILGDPKYGFADKNGAHRQMLHAYCIKVTDETPEYKGFMLKAPMPDDMKNFCTKYFGEIEDPLI